MSTTVRVAERTREKVAALAKATGRQMQQVVDDAVAAYERELFFRELGDRYAELADDEAVATERSGEAGVLRDGLADQSASLTFHGAFTNMSRLTVAASLRLHRGGGLVSPMG